jgi:glycine/D-amino acid oxidase-like deaminating enzyme/nitrite reductase/ring-hydroxylating ferredoxin subunit
VHTPDQPSYWELQTDPDLTADTAEAVPLVGTLRTDVAIIGAGVTGLMTAAAVAATGLRVTVLEHRDIAAQTTGHSTAKVTALHGAVYHELEERRGAAIARGYAEANLAGITDFERLIDEHGIECGWERQPAVTYTTEVGRTDDIIAEAQAAERAGLPVETTSNLRLPFEVAAAVRCLDQAHFDPRRFCLGLARALRRNGVEIHRSAKVITVVEGSPHSLELEGARVEADSVVQATQLPIHDPGLFFSRTKPVRSYALAARLSSPLPEGMYLGIDSPTRSVRRVGGEPHVGIFGGPSHQTGEGGDTSEFVEELEAWTRLHFDVKAVLARWSAQDRVPEDDVPFIGPMPGSAEGIYLATGYRKWGFTTSAVAARMITDLISGRLSPWTEVFDSRRAPTSAKAVGSAVEANAKVVAHFVGDRLKTMRRPPIEDLAVGEGRIVDHDGTKVAAFRHEDGTLSVVNARCTHMGCLVAWNSAETSWDCPCHGSRFAPDGAVIDGPATIPLPDPAAAGADRSGD